MSSINLVCIVGAGYLGTQIGVLCARYGYKVNMYDVSKEALQSSKKAVDDYLKEWVDTQEISVEESRNIKTRLMFHDELEAVAKLSDIVIEAVVERLDVKREVFKRLDEICSEECIIATNSSSIRVSKIESATQHPERVINMHFYSFPWRRGVLELMGGTTTSDETMSRASEFTRSIGVTPLMVLRESTGFIFNRVWRAVKKECLKVVDEGVASHEDVDRAWMSLYDTEMGPFGMMDRVGLDVVKDIEMIYLEESGNPADKPPEFLDSMIERGELGVKTGKGFYSYPNPSFEDPKWLHG
jgi:3-hydroxybutyryl-CoA dehydrogenase